MITLNDFSQQQLSKWINKSNVMLLTIDFDFKIIEYSENFKSTKQNFSTLTELITYTHRVNFINKVNACIENAEAQFFETNICLNPTDVEDIPLSAHILIEKGEDRLNVLIELHQYLSFADVKSYFNIVNNFSTTSRKLIQSERKLKNTNLKLEENIAALDFYANYDVLTNLLNRRRILEELNQEVSRTNRNHNDLCILMIDIDHFKAINDNFGHHAGDLVLVEFASRIKGQIRDYDSVGRYGGEEFVIIFPDANLESAINMAERLLTSISAEPFLIEGMAHKVSFSGGLLSFSSLQTSSSLLAKADNLLYQAKAGGRGKVCY